MILSKRKLFIIPLILFALLLSFLSLININNSYATSSQIISIKGVQLRGNEDNMHRYLVLLSDGYKQIDENVLTLSGSTEHNLDGIKIYTSKDDAGISLSSIAGRFAQNLWSTKGIFIYINNYADTYNGATVYKVTISKGTIVPAISNGVVSYYEIDNDYVFYNSNYGNQNSVYEAFSWSNVEAASDQEIQIKDGQVRGDKDLVKFKFLVLGSNSYSALDMSVNDIPNTDSFVLDKIYVYMSEDGVGIPLSTISNGFAQNLWGKVGIFIYLTDYETYNGTTIYKIVVEKGQTLPAYGGGKVASYVVDNTYTLVNQDYGKDSAKYSGFNFVKEDKEYITLNGVQLRGEKTNSRYRFLTILSSAYKDYDQGYESVDLLGYDLDKIKIYLSKDGEGIPLTSLAGRFVQNIWVAHGLFISLNEYDEKYNGSSVYKITIEEGLTIPAFKNGGITKFIISENYTFYNLSYGVEEKKYEAFNFTTVENKDVGVNTVHLRGEISDPNYRFLFIKMDSYKGLDEGYSSPDLMGYNLDKIKIYLSRDGEGIPLTSIAAKFHQNIWTDYGIFILLNEYEEKYNGSTIYKVTIEEGLVLPAVSNGQIANYTINESYTFYNSSYGVEEDKYSALRFSTIESRDVTVNTVHLRGEPTDPNYRFLFIKMNDYKGLDEGYSSPDLMGYNLDKIKIYLSKEGEGVPLTSIAVKFHQNIWTDYGVFILLNEYEEKYNGSTVYKVTIEKGLTLPAASDGEVANYVVSDDYTFYNTNYGNEDAKYSAFSWSRIEGVSANITGVQIRGDKQSVSDRYFVFFSDIYRELEQAWLIPGSDTYKASGIKFYLSKDDEEGVDFSSFNGKVAQNSWSVHGGFIQITDYDTYNAATVYKVTIAKGTKVPYLVNGEVGLLVVDKDYTFYNYLYGNESQKFSGFEWGTVEQPTSVDDIGSINLVDFHNQADEGGRYLIFVFDEGLDKPNQDVSFYEDRGLTNILDNVFLYSGTDLNQEPIKLRDVYAGRIVISMFGSSKVIGVVVEDREEINGTNLYMVKILGGTKIPYIYNDEYVTKTTKNDVAFTNDNYRRSGMIFGSTDEELRERYYESWSINFTQLITIYFSVNGLEDISFENVYVNIGETVSLKPYEKEGYKLTVKDDEGNKYYSYFFAGKKDMNISLSYDKIVEEEDKITRGCNGSLGLTIILSLLLIPVVIKRRGERV